MIDRRKLMLATMTAAAALALPGGAALAQAYPSKTITLVVSFPPGGDTDALARSFAEKLQARVGQPVVVENKTGASGTIGNSYVAKAAPDGYTLLFTPNTFATAPLVLKPGTGAVYNPLTDFTPILLAGTQSLFLITHAGSGLNTVKDVVAAAKSGKVANYASPGSGSPMHILGEMVNRSAGTKLAQVPYRGSGPAIVDLVAGHIPMMYTTLGPVAQYISQGKLVNVAVADPQRSSLAPNVPTLAEAGVKDAEVGAWQGFFGPKGMPADVVRTLNGHLNDILKMPDVQARMQTMALIPVGGEPAALAKINQYHNERYGKVIRETGIMAD
ncbi:Bug family tripartite tricarboxylate transporter substrate binding protein [Hydrogenophaga sp. BPS33]|uniref:Bug family tripartite tricarboxylate transporter substrate binding protein n=1 Tax=Hydrogenophaga sp. BPS33 TaxID=2651974 RepID=UPI0013201B63|nr:tripartite tricarboxylate transporter substrate binding protein [Hydrogenophaga sp. BPS33]QHE85517.1 tripartite tricarboxylate transporter substrate binding protein [Hydrogenophaga sp. BPS33]